MRSMMEPVSPASSARVSLPAGGGREKGRPMLTVTPGRRINQARPLIFSVPEMPTGRMGAPLRREISAEPEKAGSSCAPGSSAPRGI